MNDGFKEYVIERGRNPAEVPSARDRARIACLVLPEYIQRWMVEAGAVDPLLDSLEKTILAAEEHARSNCS